VDEAPQQEVFYEAMMNVDQTGIRLYYALVRIVRDRKHSIGCTGRHGRDLDFTCLLVPPLSCLYPLPWGYTILLPLFYTRDGHGQMANHPVMLI